MSNLLASSRYRATPATPHWQLALGDEGVAQQIADVHQCIRIILTTPKGSDPLRPEFGCDAGGYLDLPLDAARPHIVREVRAALAWEPRIRVDNVSVTQGREQSGGHAVVHITWTLADMRGPDGKNTTSVAIGGQA
ncbi:GPW/gp25 family protein [Desulfovibrio piger]|uniref:GPW/gp25 family protein n=1 Tax=Desulfovibrio piger TaxID=901 RepID=UPI002432E97E|nr:GPW/gp25 family protein [Desulfovibrio piger]MCI7507984.1 GPW/gp25 family protein [Desulfovibrio piger]